VPVSEVIKQGAVHTGNRTANVHPEDWLERVYETTPLAKSPITAIAQRTARAMVRSPWYHWFSQGYQTLRGDVTDVYLDANFANAYSTGGVKGQVLYLKMTANDAKQCVPGNHLALLTGTTETFRMGRVTSVKVSDDSHSYVAIELLEADTNDRLAEASITFRIASSSHPELSGLPDPTFRDVTEFSNQTMISKEAIQLSGTEMHTRERISPKVMRRVKRDGLFRFRVGQERGFLFSVYDSGFKDNMPWRSTRGLRPAIAENEPTHLFNYVTDTDYAQKSWLSGGWDWFKKDVLMECARYTEDTDDGNRVLFTGDYGHMSVCELAEAEGLRIYDEEKSKWGLARITKIQGLELDVEIAVHPLFKEDDGLRRHGLLYNPKDVEYVYLEGRDLTFVPRGQEVNGFTFVDGIKEGWQAEWGVRYHNLCSMGWLSGLGQDNTA